MVEQNGREIDNPHSTPIDPFSVRVQGEEERYEDLITRLRGTEAGSVEWKEVNRELDALATNLDVIQGYTFNRLRQLRDSLD